MLLVLLQPQYDVEEWGTLKNGQLLLESLLSEGSRWLSALNWEKLRLREFSNFNAELLAPKLRQRVENAQKTRFRAPLESPFSSLLHAPRSSLLAKNSGGRSRSWYIINTLSTVLAFSPGLLWRKERDFGLSLPIKGNQASCGRLWDTILLFRIHGCNVVQAAPA